jgi:hypothetical protein
LALAEWPKLSSRELAKICAVSDMFVGTVRDQLQTDCSSTRKGADGKEGKLPTKSISAAASLPVRRTGRRAGDGRGNQTGKTSRKLLNNSEQSDLLHTLYTQ